MFNRVHFEGKITDTNDLLNYYKESINRIPHTFDENLWNKLDEQLVPVRNAYNKKENAAFVL